MVPASLFTAGTTLFSTLPGFRRGTVALRSPALNVAPRCLRPRLGRPLRRRRGRGLCPLRLMVLLHLGVARRVTVVPAFELLLLLDAGISIP
jgi:hypothetical protein